MLALRIDGPSEVPELAVATQLFLGYSNAQQARAGKQPGGGGAGAGAGGGRRAEEAVTVQAALQMAAQSGFLSGFVNPRVHTLDLSACVGVVDAHALAALLRSLDHGRLAKGTLKLLLPTGCLQQQPQPAAGPGLGALALPPPPPPLGGAPPRPGIADAAHAAAPLSQLLRALAPVDGELALLGPGTLVRSDVHLRSLAGLGHGLSQLHLLDLYPYMGSLDWSALRHLPSLRLLAVTPLTPLSFVKVRSPYCGRQLVTADAHYEPVYSLGLPESQKSESSLPHALLREPCE